MDKLKLLEILRKQTAARQYDRGDAYAGYKGVCDLVDYLENLARSFEVDLEYRLATFEADVMNKLVAIEKGLENRVIEPKIKPAKVIAKIEEDEPKTKKKHGA